MPPEVEPAPPPISISTPSTTCAGGVQAAKSPRPPGRMLWNPPLVASVTTLKKASRNERPNDAPWRSHSSNVMIAVAEARIFRKSIWSLARR